MMKIRSKEHASFRPDKHGFSLIVTVAMLVLLTVIAVGLLTLSSVSIKSASINSADERARTNARMALMMAIGRLQTELGPDQRISANGSILSGQTVANPHWVGVWDSWIAGPLEEARTNPNYPGVASDHRTLGIGSDASMRPEYDQKQDYFRSWLVSGSENIEEAFEQDYSYAGIMPGSNARAVKLVAEGSLGSGVNRSEHVAVPLVSVQDENQRGGGRYGWWVSDESQKAPILYDSYESSKSLTSAQKIYRAQSPASAGNEVTPGLEAVGNDPKLEYLPSHLSLDLLTNAQGEPSKANFHAVSLRSLGVLADVREGGLKRDLNTILEQPIDRADDGDEYMLYAFDDPRFPDRTNSRVPIQDLAAYYQLYDDVPTFENERREGVRYASPALSDAIQLRVPDYDGGSFDRQKYIREYTTLYKQPVVAKIQFLVAMSARPITAADRQEIIDRKATHSSASVRNNLEPVRLTDTHKLKLGIMPMVTLWNPTNVPLVMDSSQVMRFGVPPFGLRWRKYRDGVADPVDSYWLSLGYAASRTGTGSTGGQASWPALLRLNFARYNNRPQRIVFEPGEVKVFSLPGSTAPNIHDEGRGVYLATEGSNMDVENAWDPYAIFLMPNSSPSGHSEDASPDAYQFSNTGNREECLVFGSGDRITFSIDSDSSEARSRYLDGRVGSTETSGSAFNLSMMDHRYQQYWQDGIDFLRHYQLLSRHGGSISEEARLQMGDFNQALMTPGFPGGQTPVEFESRTNAIPGSEIIATANAGEVVTVMEFTFSQGCEVGVGSSAGFGGGRRIASRPFLHSCPSAAPFIDKADKTSLYNHGWNWQVGPVNTLEDSIVTAKPGTGNGYFGGGYTVESGTTHVVQRDIPVLPPISIASLSHAQLGGFSLAYANLIGDDPDNDRYWWKSSRMRRPVGTDFQKVTATGHAGLGPQVMQAIGNSYAHPNIPAHKAVTTKTRHFDGDEGAVNDVPFVDHSYLANKALWDDYFFSSITPQQAKVQLYEAESDLSALQVAKKFFEEGEPLPNRRFTPYLANADSETISSLFDQDYLYTGGLADKIASHLMVKGSFNINSTSVEAWKIFLSSHLGNPSQYLDGGVVPSEIASESGEAVIGYGMIANTQPITGASVSTPNLPEAQWTGGRVLTNDEIEELAEAMVEQVKMRGPFLSLSEFVNRRLEGDSNSAQAERSVKGALQAAIDDESVSINSAFRSPARLIDGETAGVNFEFDEAAKGPIAYGSAAYLDQSDILRSFAGQLTPRGDTFVIRAYGDSLDVNGNVEARAWCEAVVQRVPDYTDRSDESYKKQSDINAVNKRFGRQFKISSFRWLNSSEI